MKVLGKKTQCGIRRMGLAVLAGSGLLVAAFLVLDALYPPNLERYQTVSRKVVAADGSLLRVFQIENGRLRLAVSLDEIDPLFTRMLIAYEDKRFHRHAGIDPLAVARASWQAVAAGEVVSGASTLTMQVARLLEPRRRTVAAKMTEMFRAFQLEHHFSKRQILEIYLTLAPYGGNIEGIKAASLAYFGHDGRHLTPDEAALLVVLPQSPAALRPDRHPQQAAKARNKVLDRVATDIHLDAHLVTLAKAAPVPDQRQQPSLLAAHLAARLHTSQPQDRIVTHIDASLQKRLERLAGATAESLHPNASAAILVVENNSRHVVAYVGSAGFTKKQRAGFVDMVTAIRSPGSTLKPFIYGKAFDRGLAHPRTLIMDEPRRFGTYAPTNFMDIFHGELPIAEALQRSLNVPAVAVLNRLGPVRFAEELRRTGARLHLPGQEPPGLALALGGVGMSLEDLVMLYAALADNGEVRPLVLSSAAQDAPNVSDRTALLLTANSQAALRDILSGVRSPNDRLPARYQPTPRKIAFKTGTSYGFRDAWAIGFDGAHTVGIWLGRPDGTPLPGHFGNNTAAPVLFDAFDMLPASPIPQAPAGAPTATSLPPSLRYFDKPQLSSVTGRRVSPLMLVFPLSETVVDIGDGTVPVMFSVTGGDLPLQWFVDGEPIRTSRWSRHAATRLPHPGFYKVSVLDRNGNRVSARFTAKSHSY